MDFLDNWFYILSMLLVVTAMAKTHGWDYNMPQMYFLGGTFILLIFFMAYFTFWDNGAPKVDCNGANNSNVIGEVVDNTANGNEFAAEAANDIGQPGFDGFPWSNVDTSYDNDVNRELSVDTEPRFNAVNTTVNEISCSTLVTVEFDLESETDNRAESFVLPTNELTADSYIFTQQVVGNADLLYNNSVNASNLVANGNNFPIWHSSGNDEFSDFDSQIENHGDNFFLATVDFATGTIESTHQEIEYGDLYSNSNNELDRVVNEREFPIWNPPYNEEFSDFDSQLENHGDNFVLTTVEFATGTIGSTHSENGDLYSNSIDESELPMNENDFPIWNISTNNEFFNFDNQIENHGDNFIMATVDVTTSILGPIHQEIEHGSLYSNSINDSDFAVNGSEYPIWNSPDNEFFDFDSQIENYGDSFVLSTVNLAIGTLGSTYQDIEYSNLYNNSINELNRGVNGREYPIWNPPENDEFSDFDSQIENHGDNVVSVTFDFAAGAIGPTYQDIEYGNLYNNSINELDRGVNEREYSIWNPPENDDFFDFDSQIENHDDNFAAGPIGTTYQDIEYSNLYNNSINELDRGVNEREFPIWNFANNDELYDFDSQIENHGDNFVLDTVDLATGIRGFTHQGELDRGVNGSEFSIWNPPDNEHFDFDSQIQNSNDNFIAETVARGNTHQEVGNGSDFSIWNSPDNVEFYDFDSQIENQRGNLVFETADLTAATIGTTQQEEWNGELLQSNSIDQPDLAANGGELANTKFNDSYDSNFDAGPSTSKNCGNNNKSDKKPEQPNSAEFKENLLREFGEILREVASIMQANEGNLNSINLFVNKIILLIKLANMVLISILLQHETKVNEIHAKKDETAEEYNAVSCNPFDCFVDKTENEQDATVDTEDTINEPKDVTESNFDNDLINFQEPQTGADAQLECLGNLSVNQSVSVYDRLYVSGTNKRLNNADNTTQDNETAFGECWDDLIFDLEPDISSSMDSKTFDDSLKELEYEEFQAHIKHRDASGE